jgi:rSAM/selenodomain-associated transferase 1
VSEGLIKNQINIFFLFIKYFLGTDSSILWDEYFNRNHKTKKTSLIIFARFPSKGKVKTRLAKDTGDNYALRFYTLCAEEIFRQTKRLKSFSKYLFYTEAEEKEKVMRWAGAKYLYALQAGKDLGERMLNAFELAFSHNAEKVIVVGTDVPDLNAGIIKEAERKLDEADLVIGPSNDGGYYLLGMKKVYKDLFQEIAWSSGSVFDSTMKKAEELNLKTIKLEMLRDIDTKNDLDEWLNLPQVNSLKRKIKLFNQSES